MVYLSLAQNYNVCISAQKTEDLYNDQINLLSFTLIVVVLCPECPQKCPFFLDIGFILRIIYLLDEIKRVITASA